MNPQDAIEILLYASGVGLVILALVGWASRKPPIDVDYTRVEDHHDRVNGGSEEEGREFWG